MPRSRLRQIVRFVAAPPGVTILPHDINYDGVVVDPDLVIAVVLAGSVSVAVGGGNVTVNNSGAGNADVDVYLSLDHSIDRAIGADGTTGMVPRPLVVMAAAGGGGGAGTADQVFTYVHGGGASSDFFIPLPAARVDDNYVATVQCADVTGIVGISTPNAVAGDRTPLQFRVVLTANIQNGDTLDVVVKQRT